MVLCWSRNRGTSFASLGIGDDVGLGPFLELETKYELGTLLRWDTRGEIDPFLKLRMRRGVSPPWR